jgi:hypothetical protein
LITDEPSTSPSFLSYPSLESEDKRRNDLQARRLARERKIEESLYVWEREIVPDWKVVHRDPALRKLWWGGIPTKLRASMWEKAVGNALALSKGTYFFSSHSLSPFTFSQR